MNRKLTLSLSLLQSLGLLAADFTLAELEKMMNTFEQQEKEIPPSMQRWEKYLGTFHIMTDTKYKALREKALSGYYNNIHKDEGKKRPSKPSITERNA